MNFELIKEISFQHFAHSSAMNEPMINSANKETGDLCTAVLELATDNRLVDLRKNGDVLFDGRLCSSRDGGFSQVWIILRSVYLTSN